MPSPLVSVILPAYNGQRTIRQALESVLAQTYAPMEVLVVDDASTDATLRILDEYADRIRLIRRASNSGVCGVARADAYKVIRGKYVALIDQDDLWEPTKTEKQVAFLEAHPNIPLCHTYMRVIDGNDNTLEVRHEGKIPPTGMCARELMRHCFITISSLVFRPEPLLRAKQRVGTEFANTDTETFLCMLQEHPAGFGFIPEVLGAYRRWGQGMSRRNWKWGPEDVNALSRVYRRGYWKGLMSGREARAIIAEASVKNAEHHRHAGRPGRALYFCVHGFWYGPTSPQLWGSAAKAAAQGVTRKKNKSEAGR